MCVCVCVCNRDVSSHLNYEHRVFHSEEFLKTREPAEQLFYKKVKADSVRLCLEGRQISRHLSTDTDAGEVSHL